MRHVVRLIVVLGLIAMNVAVPPAAQADSLPVPSDFRAGGGSFTLGTACNVNASVFVDNDRLPDGDGRSRATVYYQMENRPDDGRGSYYFDEWADWDQPTGRRRGYGEFDLYRQDVNPLAFDRGYVDRWRRWEGSVPTPTEVPPTNLGYSVWSYGFKTFGSSGQREDWRVVRDRSPNGAPASSTANLVSIVRKTDVPAQPLAPTMRGGTGAGPPDSRIVRVRGQDGATRAWTAESAVTFSMTGLDGVCTSANKPSAAQRDAATNPSCQPDPTELSACWERAVAANSSPSGRLDYHDDGTFARSPYCSHLSGQVITYRNANRSDCPGKMSLQEYRNLGLLPSWWCSSKTAFGFCVESQVDWIGSRQQRVWMQVRDEATGTEAHAAMPSWYGEPQGNVSRNECPRRADGSADLGNPRVCFYEGWWHGEITAQLVSDGRHPLLVEVVDDTFRSWLRGGPTNVQNRSGSRISVNRDTVGPSVTGSMDAVQDEELRFSATGVRDPGDSENAVGVNRDDVWLYACRRGSPGCGLASIPEDDPTPDRVLRRMGSVSSSDYSLTVAGLPPGEWFWKVVPYDLLGNRGQARSGPMMRVLQVQADRDASSVESGGTVEVDITANDLWSPSSASIAIDLEIGPSRGRAELIPRPGQPPLLRYSSNAGTPAGLYDSVRYRLCATADSATACARADVDISVTRPGVRVRPT